MAARKKPDTGAGVAAGKADAGDGGKDALSIPLADVKPESVRWIWKPYLPRGKLVLLEGDPGVGKSHLLAAIAAACSTGRKLPDQPRASKPARVLLLSAEDGLADTLRPRLQALKADLKRVHASDAVLILDPEGLKRLEQEIKRVRPALVGLDPIVGYLDARTDIHRANQVRRALAPLAALARRHRCTIIMVRHLTKGPRERAIYRGLGSIDFAATVRSVLLVGNDPSDPQRRILAHIKCNFAALGGSLAFRLDRGRFTWAGTSELRGEDLCQPPPTADERSARAEAADFLNKTLEAGPMAATEVRDAAKKVGIASATLNRAKRVLGIRSSRRGRHWVWVLPQGQGDQ